MHLTPDAPRRARRDGPTRRPPRPLRTRVLLRQARAARARAAGRAATDALGAVALAGLLALLALAGGGALLLPSAARHWQAALLPQEVPLRPGAGAGAALWGRPRPRLGEPAAAFASSVAASVPAEPARALRALLGRRRTGVAGLAPPLPGRGRRRAGDDCEAAARPLAVLIAGGRPDPRQPAGPLIAPADPACPPAVDVFIALAEEEEEGGGAYDAGGVDDAALRQWYRLRRARAVHVERVAAAALADLRRDLALASSAAERSVEPPPQGTVELYLRHRAFAAAAAAGREAGRAYTGFAYWRAEGAVFLRPPPEALVPAAGNGPAAVVDWPCGPAAEARSGRAVLADPAAAAALFAGGDGAVSPREHVLRQARRLAGFPTAFGFAAAELRAAGATVTRADLRRVDAEYAGGRLCVPDRQLCGDRRGDRAVVACSAAVAAARDAAARDTVYEAGREVEGGFF